MSTPSPLSGFVLAGGQSRRMGRDKALLKWNDTSLLEHMTRLLSRVTDQVRVVGRDDLPDAAPDLGPMGGILTALRHTATDANLVIALDLPLVTLEFLVFFKERMERSPNRVVACQLPSGIPICLGIPRQSVESVAAYLAAGKRAFRGFVLESEPVIVSSEDLKQAGFRDQLFFNINTPQEYRIADGLNRDCS